MKTLGQIAYEAYIESTGGKSLITGDTLPPYEQLNTDVQKAWEYAADAIAASVGRADARSATIQS